MTAVNVDLTITVDIGVTFADEKSIFRKSLFTIKQNGSRIEHIKGKKTTKQDSENT